MDALITLQFKVDDERVLDHVLTVIEHFLPYMVDNVTITSVPSR